MKMMLSEMDKYEELIVQYLTDTISNVDNDSLKSWIKASGENQNFFDEYCNVWLATKSVSNKLEFDVTSAYSHFLDRVSQYEAKAEEYSFLDKAKQIILSVYKIAAILILTFCLGGAAYWVLSKNSGTKLLSYQEITAPLGSKTEIVLPDQSKVILNAGSKLKYSSDYGTVKREVILDGEGYFTVAHDKTRKFIVKAGKMEIIALGTQFNVKAYNTEKTIETTLVEGSVQIQRELTGKGNDPKSNIIAILKPNQRLIIYKNEDYLKNLTTPANILLEQGIDLRALISWKENRWIIKSQTLGDLASQIERKYNVVVNFEDNHIKQFHFSGTFQNESIEQVLTAISFSSPVAFNIKGRNISLKINKDMSGRYKSLLN
jgi:transmembrane sensor